MYSRLQNLHRVLASILQTRARRRGGGPTPHSWLTPQNPYSLSIYLSLAVFMQNSTGWGYNPILGIRYKGYRVDNGYRVNQKWWDYKDELNSLNATIQRLNYVLYLKYNLSMDFNGFQWILLKQVYRIWQKKCVQSQEILNIRKRIVQIPYNPLYSLMFCG